MTNVQYIRKFMFNFARYRLSDEKGSELFLEINYKNNTYEVIPLSDELNGLFLKEAQKVAENLLSRKHDANFVDRLII